MSSLMTETLLQPDVTPLPPETGFSSSRDRVRIHRAQEIRTVPRGGFSSAAPNSISSKCVGTSTPICAASASMNVTRSSYFSQMPWQSPDNTPSAFRRPSSAASTHPSRLIAGEQFGR
jgi:hypothetical protein